MTDPTKRTPAEVLQKLYDLHAEIEAWPVDPKAGHLMAERAARGDPEAALRVLDETSPSVPPDPGGEIDG